MFCHNKWQIQAYFCHDKRRVLSRPTCVCRDKTFIVTKMVLVAALANDSLVLSWGSSCVLPDFQPTLPVPSVHSDRCHITEAGSFIIIIRNTYIAPNPTRLAQSTSQFKTRINARISTWNTHTPGDPTPTAKRRQTCIHARTISATQTWKEECL